MPIRLALACLAPACLALTLTAAPEAFADAQDAAPVTTASSMALPPSAPKPSPLRMQSAAEVLAGAAPVSDGKIHGMVQVGVGTGGYREAAVEAHGQPTPGVDVSVAASAVQLPEYRAPERSAPSH